MHRVPETSRRDALVPRMIVPACYVSQNLIMYLTNLEFSNIAKHWYPDWCRLEVLRTEVSSGLG